MAFTAFGKTQNLEAGKLLYLPTGKPHTVKGIENSSLLQTVLLPKHLVARRGCCHATLSPRSS